MGWRIPRIWEGGDVWILGGGPSLPEQFGVPAEIIKQVQDKTLTPAAYSPYMVDIHRKHVIAINTAYLIGDWIDALFFGDPGWFLHNKDSIAKFPGLKMTCVPNNQKLMRQNGVKVFERNSRGYGIAKTAGKVCWNKNSGAAAINVAYHAGASRVILVGFDMNTGATGETHWHKLHVKHDNKPKATTRQRFDRHLASFNPISKEALKLGLEIINASPNSSITQFKKMHVKDLI